MQYAAYSYYEIRYLLGRSPAVPEEVFGYWEKQARLLIDRNTFNRITKDPSLLTDQVKDCCCELAELLYQADQIYGRNLTPGRGLMPAKSCLRSTATNYRWRSWTGDFPGNCHWAGSWQNWKRAGS